MRVARAAQPGIPPIWSKSRNCSNKISKNILKIVLLNTLFDIFLEVEHVWGIPGCTALATLKYMLS